MGVKSMEKFKLGIIAILVIFLVGGCYAIYHGNDITNNAATDISSSVNAPNDEVNNQQTYLQNDDINTLKEISQDNNINNFATALETTYRKIPGAEVLVNANIDFTDLYLQCVACGGFLPLGEVTKALPEDAICPDLCGGDSVNADRRYAVTYEFAKEFYDKYGRHPEDIAEEIQPANVSENYDDANIPEVIGPGIYVPEDANLIYEDGDIQIYDNGMEVHGMNSNSDVVYDSGGLDIPSNPTVIYDMNNPNNLQ